MVLDASDDQRYLDALDRRRLSVLVAQADSLRLQIFASVAMVGALVWPAVSAPAVLAWAVAVLVAREWRLRHLRRWLADETTPVLMRMPQFLLSSALFGAICGAAALFMPWLSRERDALLTMIMLSWAAGAVSTTSPLLRNYVMYSAGIYVPVTVMWMADGAALSIGVAGLIVMLAGVQWRFAKHNATVFEESFRIRRENEQLVAELGTARDRAEAAHQAKTRFIAAASHDLRQPLHALTLHTGLLALDPATPDAPRIVADISASIESLGKLLDSLLDISKLDAGVVVVERHRILLARLLAHLAHMHEAQARQKGLRLRFECPREAVVETDAVLLERLLRNLIDNALKYTDQGEVVVVASGDAVIEVSVRDTGRGIPVEHQSKIFDEFYQVPGQAGGDERRQGLGLGLSIVRRLALLLELPLSLRSEPGTGTAVSFTLARVDADPKGPAAETTPPQSLQGLRVLLIEDEERVRRATRGVLNHFGCHTVEASGSEEALAQARIHSPDFVLADYRLSDKDSGLDAIALLRAHWPALPALLITGDTSPDRLREAEGTGLPLLHKPVTVGRLHAAIDAVLAHHRRPLEGAGG